MVIIENGFGVFMTYLQRFSIAGALTRATNIQNQMSRFESGQRIHYIVRSAIQEWL